MNRDTICVQGGYTPGNGEPRQIPIIQSTTFKYATSEDMGKLFDLEADGYFYSRLQNPTCDLVAKKICELEGGTAAGMIGRWKQKRKAPARGRFTANAAYPFIRTNALRALAGARKKVIRSKLHLRHLSEGIG